MFLVMLIKTIEYHEYIVLRDLEVYCIVTKGIAAPKFEQPGGGVQFMHRQSIRLECQDGFIEEDESWMHKSI